VKLAILELLVVTAALPALDASEKTSVELLLILFRIALPAVAVSRKVRVPLLASTRCRPYVVKYRPRSTVRCSKVSMLPSALADEADPRVGYLSQIGALVS